MTTLAKNTHLNLLFSQDKAVECNGDGGVFSVKNDANGNRTHENGIKYAPRPNSFSRSFATYGNSNNIIGNRLTNTAYPAF